MPIYSHSRLNTFDQCPLQFKYRYLDRIRVERENIEAFTGKLVHSVLEEVWGEGKPIGECSLDQALDRFESLWKSEWSDRVRVVKSGYRPDYYRDMGRRCLQNFFQLKDTLRKVRTLAIEEKITLSLDSHGKYRMIGFIDRLIRAEDGTHEIHDYKTSGRLPTQKSLDADRQLAIYHLGLEKRLGSSTPVRLVWHYLAFGKTFQSSRTPGQLDSLRLELIERIRKIETAREFPAKESFLCRWCVYEEICPARGGKSPVKVETDQERVEEGIRLVDGYVALVQKTDATPEIVSAELDRHRNALVDHSQRRGVDTVVGRTHVARIRKQSWIRIPPAGTERRVSLESLLRMENLWDGTSEMDPHQVLLKVEERAESSRLKEVISAHGGDIEESSEIQLVPLGGGQLKFFN